MTACNYIRGPSQPINVAAPANTTVQCKAPVPQIMTFDDAYTAAVINGKRLVECSIRHDGLIQFEQSRQGKTDVTSATSAP